MKCTHCGGQLEETEQIFSNGTKHIKLLCSDCRMWNGYKKQIVDSTKFEMPFGKHKGKTLGAICEDNPHYLLWAKDNFKGNIKRRIEDVLSKKNVTKNLCIKDIPEEE